MKPKPVDYEHLYDMLMESSELLDCALKIVEEYDNSWQYGVVVDEEGKWMTKFDYEMLSRIVFTVKMHIQKIINPEE